MPDVTKMNDRELLALFESLGGGGGTRKELLRRLARGERCAEVLRQQTCPACRQKLGRPKENPELECVCDAARAALQETNDA